MKSREEMLAAAQAAASTIQTQMEQANAKLDQVEVEGISGGGLVRIHATAKGRIRRVEIDPSLLNPSEQQMVEDLIAAAINDARVKADQASNSEMAKMTQGLPLPAGFKLPFS
ncbi:MAG: YbaB/EbfC family nucleoid-associated protein [Sphingopyxis sp.]